MSTKDKKDYIDIYDANGNVTTMELVFGFECNKIHYIVYKPLDGEDLYAAKYIKSINEDFDSNLTSEELDVCNKIYEEMKNDKK